MMVQRRSGRALSRRLGTPDAVLMGLGSMIGAGIFAAYGPASAAAGSGPLVLMALALAAFVAYCNAVASAQLAAEHPVSGGSYVYGRRQLGPWSGFLAGWGFIVGKTASCAAMALTFAAYVVPGPGWLQRGVALAAVLGLATLNYQGVTRTAKATRVLVACTLVILACFVVVVLIAGTPRVDRLVGGDTATHPYGVVQAAGLLFFAFAGYARLATMSEEVRDPARTIPRAIPLALALTVAVYAAVGSVALAAAGADELAEATSPLLHAARAADVGELGPLLRVGAALASLGALLALMAGIGRTTLAMARERDLPGWLEAVHPRTRVPHHAEVALAMVVSVLVVSTDLRGAIGFSSFGVLLYYAVANAAAYTQTGAARRWPRVFNVAGVVGCCGLAATLPWHSVVTGLVVFAVGFSGRWLVLRRRRVEVR